VCLYLLFNIANSILVVLVIKHHSASLMYLITTCRLPLLQFAFSLKFIQNPPDTFSTFNILGFIIVCLGLLIYRSTELLWVQKILEKIKKKEKRKKEERIDEESNILLEETKEKGETITFGGGASGAGGIDVTSLGIKVALAIGGALGLVVGVLIGILIPYLK